MVTGSALARRPVSKKGAVNTPAKAERRETRSCLFMGAICFFPDHGLRTDGHELGRSRVLVSNDPVSRKNEANVRTRPIPAAPLCVVDCFKPSTGTDQPTGCFCS